MRLDLGAKVMSSDGKDVGQVDQLVLDPRTETIEEFVVHKGFLVQHDIIIPTSSVQEGMEGGTVRLTLTADEVAQLPQFEETAYIASPLGLSSGGGAYPGDVLNTSGGILWPASIYTSGATRDGFSGVSATGGGVDDDIGHAGGGDGSLAGTESDNIMQARPDDVFLTTGTDVYAGGEKIGTVEEIVVDAQSGKVVALVVKHGLFGGKHYRIPAQYIDETSSSMISLTMPPGRMEQFAVSHE